MATQTNHRITPEGILYPRSVAVIGASADTGKFGGRVMNYLTKNGYDGRIVPVNPGRDSVFGIDCVKHISEAEPVDIALLALPAGQLVEAIADCAAAGVGGCVIMTTGFAEANAEGAERQRALIDIARDSGMRLIGPNCMGLMSPHRGLAFTSSVVLEVGPLRPGPIGLISQSGALMVSLYSRADDAGIGFSACVSLGNQADMEICDFLEFLIADDRTEAICLYIEGLRDSGRFLALARQARAAGKPLLAVKTGRTEDGVRAAKSHTASLAGAYDVFAAACRDNGVLLLDDPDAMIRLADSLVRWGAPGPGGIAVLSGSGGGVGLAVDRLSEAGMPLARLGSETKSALGEILLPPQADNPVDFGGRTIDDAFECQRRAVAALAGDPDVGMLWFVLSTSPAYEQSTEAQAEAALACGKPFGFTVMPGAAADAPREILRRLDCPFTESFDDSLRIFQGMIDCRAMSATPAAAPSRPAHLPDAAPELPQGLRTEPEVKTLLAEYGIPVTREAIAADGEAAGRAAAEIGFPVALKAVSRGLIHKSDIGAVRLGLADENAVRDACAVMERALRDHGHALDGFSVQEMRKPELELLLGVKQDPQFGPVIVVGAGGTLADLLKDVALALAPVDADRARRLLQDLAIWPLLNDYRGRGRLDIDAVVSAIVALGWLAHDGGGRIAELDINPLGVGLNGDGAVALDARARIAAPGGE